MTGNMEYCGFIVIPVILIFIDFFEYINQEFKCSTKCKFTEGLNAESVKTT